jgi:hypothetical protein
MNHPMNNHTLAVIPGASPEFVINDGTDEKYNIRRAGGYNCSGQIIAQVQMNKLRLVVQYVGPPPFGSGTMLLDRPAAQKLMDACKDYLGQA